MSEQETMDPLDGHEHEQAQDEPQASAQGRDERGVFLRDALVFQGKLLVDGLRDLALMPVSLIAAAVDLVKRDEPVGRRFYDVVHFGQQTEAWIDLFEAAERAPETERPRPTIDAPSLDDFVDQFEAKVRAEHERGDLSGAAKQAVEELIEAARRVVADAKGR